MPRSYDQGNRTRVVLPEMTAEDFLEVEAHLEQAELVIRKRNVYPKTVRTLEDLQRLITGEQLRISHARNEASAKEQLTERLRSRAAMVR
jgi:hypothetical protein